MDVAKKLRCRLNHPRQRPSRRLLGPSMRRASSMDSYKAVLSPIARWPRPVVNHGPDEWPRAMLPPPAQVRHERTASTLLEGSSLWFDARLAVVSSVDAQSAGFCLGLTNELGDGDRSMFYRVEAAERGRRRRCGP